MVSMENAFGRISITGNYFAELVSLAAQSGFGVAGMATSCPKDSFKNFLNPDYPEKGVRVVELNGELLVELHIKVVYGLNIPAAAKSISHKVKYVVEEATGLKVAKVNVSVDDVMA